MKDTKSTPSTLATEAQPVFLSLDEVAKRWRKDRSHVWRLIDKKLLPAYDFSSTSRRSSWSVKLSDIESYEAQRRKG